ncbi:putative dna replication protein 4 protein [Phialemonium atrogriseum]|uniref:Dna replication protein 4 protein n=1 Tax=Phialemonium atrogriseum TaxID=1093897 RepID=A0AAJ0C834_9PEZI|nr:putative dna replication protein 4 protein [Phialemonium atrogriseum]KAK1771894.1 putative dna replication protein 4 protein [Phialemonium atrogriseum]
MLKSTYTPSPGLSPAALPAGWTEHKAPTGHTYYHNASTGQSTYRRPGAPPPTDPTTSFLQHQAAAPAINLSDPATANAFMAQYASGPPAARRAPDGRGAGGGGRPRPQPTDRPRAKVAIPGCEPWLLVYTRYGRRFAHNPARNASYWRIPDRLKLGILELDRERIRRKAEGLGSEDEGEDKGAADAGPGTTTTTGDGGVVEKATAGEQGPAYDSDEYEEVEVTDDEGDEEDGNAAKRQRTGEPGEDEEAVVEFTEADIAAQLQAMGEQYEEEGAEDWAEGEQGLPLSDEDARELFKDLLNDFGINPYSPWEKLIEEGKVFDDARYSVLGTMKARKEAWEEWSRDKMKQLKELRAKEGKKDPRIAYMAFLQERATPKLYWPEFRRKYKKETPMKDTSLSDKDREKWYREHINRLKQPQPTLKADLKALLESVPLSELNNRTNPSHLPTRLLVDIRYASLDPAVRDPIVEAYLQTLGPPPEEAEAAEDEAAARAREERARRERALQERERAVAEEKRRQEKKLLHGRASLRDEERELERAMQVGKRGLQSQLSGAQNGGV